PQNIAFSGVWDLPFGKRRRWLNNPSRFTGALVNGWNVNWIYRFLSGNPVNRTDARFSCASYFAPNQDRDHWFNNDPTCYRSRAGYTLRVVEDRFPNIRQMDAPALNLSASRSFPIRERGASSFASSPSISPTRRSMACPPRISAATA